MNTEAPMMNPTPSKADFLEKLKQHVDEITRLSSTHSDCLSAIESQKMAIIAGALRNFCADLKNTVSAELPTPKNLAHKFSTKLWAAVGEEVLTKIIRRNRKTLPSDWQHCASHEFCNATGCMIEAFKSFGIDDPEEDESLKALWSAAWLYAMKAEFYQGFARCFLDLDVYSMPPIPPEWDDISDPNEPCPSFRTYRGFIVYIDYPLAQRANKNTVRYTAHDDPEIFEEYEIVFPTDDWEMLLKYVDNGPTKHVLRRIEKLADEARYQDDEDDSSQRQIIAENRLIDAVEALGIDCSDYEISKMSVGERIEDALRRVREKFA